MSAFLAPADRKRLVTAIQKAERDTSGEIVVSIRKHVHGDIDEAARALFLKKKLDRTKDRNGVLVLIAHQDRQLAVIGDQGIDQRVPENFWDGIIGRITSRFKQDDIIGGPEAGILEIGRQLQAYFPYQSDDINELPDEADEED